MTLLFADTDSLMYEIDTEGFYNEFSKNKEMFDFSNYSVKSKYYNDSNALVVGKMKDELGGYAIADFVGIKPKCTRLVNIKKQNVQTKMLLLK